MQILEKKHASSFNYYKRMTYKQSPIFRNLDNFPPGAFYLTPSFSLHY